MAPNKTLFWLLLTAAILLVAYISRQRNHDEAALYEFSVAVPFYGVGDLYSVKDEHGFKIIKILGQ